MLSELSPRPGNFRSLWDLWSGHLRLCRAHAWVQLATGVAATFVPYTVDHRVRFTLAFCRVPLTCSYSSSTKVSISSQLPDVSPASPGIL